MSRPGLAVARAWTIHGAALAILMAVFALYLEPDFMVMLAQQFWGCF